MDRSRLAANVVLITAFALAALVGAGMAALALTPSRRRGRAVTGTTPTRETDHRWLANAAEVARAGRRLLDAIEPIIHDDLGAPLRASTIDGLDTLTHDLAELAADAPTNMDQRVCRSVALQSQGISQALGAASNHVTRSELSDHYDAFQTALTDLEQHVHLL